MIAVAGLTATSLVAAGDATPAATEPPAPVSFELLTPRVAAVHVFFDGIPARFAFQISAPGPLDLQVQLVRQPGGRIVRHIALAAVAPLTDQRVQWDGLTDAARVAPNGRYAVRVLPAAGGVTRRVGALTLRSHVYPVRGAHADRGPIGEFGAPRSGGRIHEGFDVNAACGTPLVAARGGRVVRNVYDPVLYGNLLVIRGRLTRRDYWYAHLVRRAPFGVGEHIRTGARIGRVGDTGNARTVGCHLHFEIHQAGVPIDPKPELHAWDGWS